MRKKQIPKDAAQIEASQSSYGSLTTSVNYEYRYPPGLDLNPHKALHRRLKEAILERANLSQEHMSQRYTEWEEIKKMLTLYMPLSEAEKLDRNRDSRTPVSIVVPMAYAHEETLLTYWTMAMIQSPIFQYRGQGPEDVIGAIKMEKHVEWQSAKMKHALAIHTMGRDAFRYGFGPVSVRWTVETGKKWTPISIMGLNLGLGNRETEGITLEANELDAIDPHLYLPDPNVPVEDVQSGEFVGIRNRENLPALLAREQRQPDLYFNVKYCRHITGISSLLYDNTLDYTEDKKRDTFAYPVDNSVLRPMDTISMYINLIPAEWGLGDSEYPEKWMFTLVGDEIIIQAGKIDFKHGKFPVAVAAPDYDGHSLLPLGRIETMMGIQTVVNFLFNSHVANIRKAVNNMILLDPERVNLLDVLDTRFGMIARTRRSHWGQGIKDVMEQFPVTDVTRGHMADVAQILDFAPQVSGATQNLQGIMRTTSERRSASEARDTRVSALSRMERIARIAGIQAMQELGNMIAHNTQQFATMEIYAEVMGKWEEILQSEFGGIIVNDRLPIRPDDLLVNFDVIALDGSLPKAEFAPEMLQLLQIAQTNPVVSVNLDQWRFFKSIARRMGITEIDEFRMKQMPAMNAQVMPNEQVAAQAQAGNLVAL